MNYWFKKNLFWIFKRHVSSAKWSSWENVIALRRLFIYIKERRGPRIIVCSEKRDQEDPSGAKFLSLSVSGLKSWGGSRITATSKMERFVIIVNGWNPLIIITKRSIMDVAAVLNPPLKPLIVTNCLLYLLFHNESLWSNASWSSVSDAFCKSIKISETKRSLSNTFLIFSIRPIIVCSVEKIFETQAVFLTVRCGPLKIT